MEDELARTLERILERAGPRLLSHMPLLLPNCVDESAKTANKNKWMNWLRTLLDGRLAPNCGSNYNDKNVVNAMFDACVQSCAWLDVMNILAHLAMVVRKVRGKTTPPSRSPPSHYESPDYYNGGPGIDGRHSP